MFLALKETGKGSLRELADTYDISKEHLRKIAHKLVQEQYLTSTRGRSGGLALAIPPADIKLGTVIRLTEENFKLVECFDVVNNRCILKETCTLQRVLNEALLAFLEVLDQYTLKDLLMPRNALKTTLGL